MCHGLLLDPPHWHDTLKCRAKRGMGWSPTVPRDTRGESSRTQPWPWPLNLKVVLKNKKNADALKGRGQGWVLLDSPRVSRGTVGPTPVPHFVCQFRIILNWGGSYSTLRHAGEV